MEEGFDFLGFNIKHYKASKRRQGIVIQSKPSRRSISSFKKPMDLEWKRGLSWSTKQVIEKLNPILAMAQEEVLGENKGEK